MFGFVSANTRELDKSQQQRYNSVYCGICRQIRIRSSSIARLGLSYDMAFLALLLSSLYEPEEVSGKRACGLHPIRPRPWADNPYIAYSADMNVALAYYNFLDDYEDEGRAGAKFLADRFETGLGAIEERWPRQCESIRTCIRELSLLEKEGCSDPDRTAGCFGRLMGELLVVEEDLWAPTLRQMGDALGRFIYLVDAAVDYVKDEKKHRYNPFRAQGYGEDWEKWELYLTLIMGRCCQYYEKLPLVQDKAILDNILYNGVWMQFHAMGQRRKKKQEGKHGSL